MPTVRDPIKRKAYYRKHYAEKRTWYYERNERERLRRREIVAQAKSVACADCHRSYDPVCMDFDHIRGNKLGEVSRIAVAGSTGKLLREMVKCEVVCSNCHRLRTKARQCRDADVGSGSSP